MAFEPLEIIAYMIELHGQIGCLKVKSDHLHPGIPTRDWIVVFGMYSCSFRVGSAYLVGVVIEEAGDVRLLQVLLDLRLSD